MAISYKNQGYTLATSNVTTVLSINTSSVAIIKEISVTNDTAVSCTVDYLFHDASTSTDYKFFNMDVAPNTFNNAVRNALVLEEGDFLKVQAETADAISGQISYALLTRTGENG